MVKPGTKETKETEKAETACQKLKPDMRLSMCAVAGSDVKNGLRRFMSPF